MIKIFKYINQKQWLYICVSLAFIVFQVWLDLKLPDYMSAITRLVQTPGSTMGDILTQGAFMLSCALGSMLTSIVVCFFAAKVASGLSYTLRGKVYDKTMDFSMEELNTFSTASLINRTTNDITQVQMIIAMGLQAIVKAPILAVWAVLKISGKSWQWTTATAVAVFCLLIMLCFIILIAMPRFKKIQSFTDSLNRVTREHLSGIRVVHAYNAEDYQEEKFAEVNNALTQNNMVANRVMAIMSPSMTLISSGVTLAVYWIGVYMIDAASMGSRLAIFSDMVVFSNYAMQVIMAFMLLSFIFIMLPRAQVSAKRIIEVLDTTTNIKDGTVTSKDKKSTGTVEFKNVSFRYPDAANDALKDISFKVNKGETVAFIGATGSGKTSLINLIPRFYDATKGQVLVDGIDVKEYVQEELRDCIGYVSQKAFLFRGTVASNVGYGEKSNKENTKEEIVNAISIAQSTDFVSKMDGEYDAAIAQGGTNVSGGQRQRLSIARAIARNPEILIFDDSFSALDYKTDRALRKDLNDKTTNITKLIVAQRIGTIRNADKIIVLEHGKIVGQGTHAELLKNCETYLEIANSQLSKEEL